MHKNIRAHTNIILQQYVSARHRQQRPRTSWTFRPSTSQRRSCASVSPRVRDPEPWCPHSLGSDEAPNCHGDALQCPLGSRRLRCGESHRCDLLQDGLLTAVKGQPGGFLYCRWMTHFKLIPPTMSKRYFFCMDSAFRNVDSRVNLALRYRIWTASSLVETLCLAFCSSRAALPSLQA